MSEDRELRAALVNLLMRLDGWANDPDGRYELADEVVDIARRDVRAALRIVNGLPPAMSDEPQPAEWQGHNHALRTFGGHHVERPFPGCPKCLFAEQAIGDD